MKITDLYESEFLDDDDEIIPWMEKAFLDFASSKLRIDSDGLVYTKYLDLSRSIDKLKFQFKSVTGYFDCNSSNITSLKGCPKSVGEYFNCSHISITSLKYCPLSIGSNFYCRNIKITDPKEYRHALYSEITGKFESNNEKVNDIINTYSGSDNRKYWAKAINLLSRVEL